VASVTARVTANTDQLAGQTVTAAAGVTFPTSVASPTNITAGTITTVTNLTNAPTSGDLTAAMKASVTAAVPTVGAIADQVWDELLSGHSVSGSTGEALTASGGAGDPWITALPGAYSAGQAGYIVGNAATVNADALLNRDMSAVSDTNSRSPLNALRNIRNGFSIAGATMTVLKEDDSTPAYTRTLATDAAAIPITGVS
jgi:hypothetical protein